MTNSASVSNNNNGVATVQSATGTFPVTTGSGGANAFYNTSTQVSATGVSQGFAAAARIDNLTNVNLNVGTTNANIANIGNVAFAPGTAPSFLPNADFVNLPQGFQDTLGQRATELAKNSFNGALSDLGLKNVTAVGANAAEAAAGAVQGAVGAVAAPSPGAAAAAAAGGGGGLRYPKDMVDEQDRILFTEEDGKSVILGIQPQISDSNAVEWGGSQLNAIQLAFAQAAEKLLGNGKDNFGQTFGNVGEELMKKFAWYWQNGDNRQLFRNYIVEQATGLQGLSARNNDGKGGIILNPNLELVFTGPTLRPFTFTFRMTSREKEESDNIRKIIRFFKENMAPRGKQGSVALKRPKYFDIEYLGKAASSGSLNKIKRCALTNCSVDYTPDGSYMTYQDDGAMTAYNLTLQFQEIEPVYDQDYKEVPADQIGY